MVKDESEIFAFLRQHGGVPGDIGRYNGSAALRRELGELRKCRERTVEALKSNPDDLSLQKELAEFNVQIIKLLEKII